MPSDEALNIEADIRDRADHVSGEHQGMLGQRAGGVSGDMAGPRCWLDRDAARAGQPFSPVSVYSFDGVRGTSGRMVSMSDKDRRHLPGNERMKRRSSLEAGFDRYLSRQLHEIYDPVLNEAIPDEIAALLEQFEQRPNGEDKTPESD
jgi:hypothetical protein